MQISEIESKSTETMSKKSMSTPAVAPGDKKNVGVTFLYNMQVS